MLDVLAYLFSRGAADYVGDARAVWNFHANSAFPAVSLFEISVNSLKVAFLLGLDICDEIPLTREDVKEASFDISLKVKSRTPSVCFVAILGLRRYLISAHYF